MFCLGHNNYLLTGNKVALFSSRQSQDILLPSDSEGNNSSRVCRDEKKALYYRLIRNFSSSLYINQNKKHQNRHCRVIYIKTNVRTIYNQNKHAFKIKK